jgi:iron complex outermembrane receptor protein
MKSGTSASFFSRRVRAAVLVGAAVCPLALTPAPAFAEEGAQDTTTEARGGTSQNDPVNPDGDILVTAQRRTQRLQDVPLTVNVVSGEALQDRNFHDLQQLQYTTPSLQVNGRAGPGVNDYFIRGVGTAIFSNSIEYSVSTVLDGVVLALPEMGSQQYFDVDRIEVLSGPPTGRASALSKASSMRNLVRSIAPARALPAASKAL